MSDDGDTSTTAASPIVLVGRFDAVYPEYYGTKKQNAPESEKRLLSRCRQQRLQALREHRPKFNHTTITRPRGSLSLADSLTSQTPNPNINLLLRPPGVYSERDIYCDCEACSENRESQLKADRWWLSDQRDRALKYKKKPCNRLLPMSANTVALRRVKGLVPKGPDWQSPMLRTIEEYKPNKEKFQQMRRVFMNVEERAQLDSIVIQTEQKIRRMIGSADWTAQVILVFSSLGASRGAYFRSYRLQRFLEAKGMEHFAVDINRDIGEDSLDIPLLHRWNDANYLLRDFRKICSQVECPVLVPQLLVDGVPLGSLEEVLTLEDEADLDYIFARTACPNCLAERPRSAKHCKRCGAVFRSLLCTEFASPEDLKLLLTRSEMKAAMVKAPTPDHWAKRESVLSTRKLKGI